MMRFKKGSMAAIAGAGEREQHAVALSRDLRVGECSRVSQRMLLAAVEELAIRVEHGSPHLAVPLLREGVSHGDSALGESSLEFFGRGKIAAKGEDGVRQSEVMSDFTSTPFKVTKIQCRARTRQDRVDLATYLIVLSSFFY